MLVAITGDQASVPFWLQVTTIALAPMLGLAGVAIGSLLKDRSDRRSALLSERRVIYAEYVEALSELNVWGGERLPAAVRSRDPARLRALLDDMHRHNAAIATKYHHVDLIAGSRVAEVAKQGFMLCGLAALIGYRSVSDGFDRQDVSTLNHASLRVLADFRDAALAEMGVPRRQRRRSDLREPDFDKVKDMARAAGISEEHITGTTPTHRDTP